MNGAHLYTNLWGMRSRVESWGMCCHGAVGEQSPHPAHEHRARAALWNMGYGLCGVHICGRAALTRVHSHTPPGARPLPASPAPHNRSL
eukprot:388927-Prymnesium_polylepis.3